MIIPTSPLVPQGLINHRRGLVKARFQMGVVPMMIIQAIAAKGYTIVEVEVYNPIRADQRIPKAQRGLKMYLDFLTADTAVNM
mgnify:CR=1 FL=1